MPQPHELGLKKFLQLCGYCVGHVITAIYLMQESGKKVYVKGTVIRYYLVDFVVEQSPPYRTPIHL
jgi:hypothetical protein